MMSGACPPKKIKVKKCVSTYFKDVQEQEQEELLKKWLHPNLSNACTPESGDIGLVSSTEEESLMKEGNHKEVK